MAPPGPIPNPEVKHQHVDGSRTTGPARVDSRQGSNEAPEPRGSGASSVYTTRLREPSFSLKAQPCFHHRQRRFFTTPVRAFFTASVGELQAYEAGERFRKLADARGEEPGMRPVVKKNACGIWVKNALRARGEEFLPEAGMERESCKRMRQVRGSGSSLALAVKNRACARW